MCIKYNNIIQKIQVDTHDNIFKLPTTKELKLLVFV